MDLILILLSIGFIVLSILMDFSMIFAFLLGIIVVFTYLIFKGKKVKTLADIVANGVFESRVVFLLILFMGLVISSWMASGIVPTMIFYGFDFVNKGNFILNSFLIASICSLFMGTALGCFSTIGMALFCLGQGLGLPEPVLLGAIVSGCFMADKMSPISSLVNLMLGISGQSYKDFFVSSLKTILPTVIISGIIFYIIGEVFSKELEAEKLLSYKLALYSQYVISAWYFLVPIGMIILSIKGVKIINNLIASISISSVIAIFVQKIPFKEYIDILIWGFKGADVLDLKGLIQGGGIMSMLEVFIIVLLAVILSTIFVETGMLDNIMGTFFKKKTSYFILVCKTAFFSSLLTVTTCDQTCGILIPVKFLKNRFENFKDGKGTLTRTISDSGIIIAPLMNWNVNSIVIFTVTGVTAFSYAPYAVLCYIAPIITILVGFLEGKGYKIKN